MEKDDVKQNIAKSASQANHETSSQNSVSISAPTYQLQADVAQLEQEGEEKSGKPESREYKIDSVSVANSQASGKSHASLSAPTYQLRADVAQLEQEGEEKSSDEKSSHVSQGSDGLPNDIKSGIESLSGLSMDDVKVNFNSTKPAQLKAHAYAQGSNIEIGPGQEKHLPHEAWHVVQQKQGRVQPTMQMKGQVNVNDDKGLEKEADVMGEKAVQMKTDTPPDLSKSLTSSSIQGIVQRVEKDVIVTGVSHLVEMQGKSLQARDYGNDDSGPEIIHGQELVIDTDSKVRSRRGPNQEAQNKEEPTKTNREVDQEGEHIYNWYKVLKIDGKAAQANMYVREDVFNDIVADNERGAAANFITNSNTVVDAVTAVPATIIGNEGITGAADALNGKTAFTNTAGTIPKLDDNGNKVLDENGKVVMVNATSDGDRDKAAAMGQVGDYMTGVTGILGMASGFVALGDPEAKATDLIMAALDIEQGAMKTGEAVSKLVHTYSGSDSPTTASQFGSTFESFGAAFGAIKEGFQGMHKLIKLINDHQDYSTQEKATAAGEIAKHALESAKGIILSIKAAMELVNGSASGGLMAAVPGLDIAISGVNMIMQGYYLHISNNSRTVMNDRRKELRGEHQHGDKFDDASEEYRKYDAAVSNKKAVLKDYLDEYNNPKTKKKRKDKIKPKIDRLEIEIETLEKHTVEDVSREEVAEYTMATELRDANKKRVVRQGIHLVTEMAKIAGSIATLTGVGAMAGVGIKGAAAATDLALPAARMAKQKARDVKAKSNAKDKLDEGSIMQKGKFYNLDTSKSSMAKNDFRIKQVKYLIKLIVDAAYKDPEKDKASFKNVQNYLKASGVSERKLFKKNGDPQKQIKILLDAFQQREL